MPGYVPAHGIEQRPILRPDMKSGWPGIIAIGCSYARQRSDDRLAIHGQARPW